MLVLRVERADGRARVTLFGDDGVEVAAWEQADDRDRIELQRSHDGAVALVVVDDVISAVRLAEREIAAQCRDERGIEAAFPLDRAWTLELAGELDIDGGHTGFHGGGVGFLWTGPEDERPDKAEIARWRAELSAAAKAPVRRRLAVRRDGGTALVHESSAAPAEGGEVLLWPPIAGPAGVLLRHAIVTDEGNSHDAAPQPPWLVRADGTVSQLGFELGVSPLLALPGDRWLLPGVDTVWRDDYDEPLSVLDADGGIEELLVGGRPVPVSRILREAAPELLDALPPVPPHQDVPWTTVAARLHAEELQLTINVETDAETERWTILVASVPLTGTAPSRIVARFESTPAAQVAVAP